MLTSFRRITQARRDEGASHGDSAPSRRRRPFLAAASMLTSAAMISAAIVGLTVAPVQADERSDAQSKKAEAQRKQAELMSSLEGVSAELGQAYLDLQAANSQVTQAEAALSAAESVLAEKQREQQIAADKLATAQTQLDQLNEQSKKAEETSADNRASIASMVVSTYQGDSSLTSWTYVLASDSVEDLTQRASTMEIASGIQESVLATAEGERAQAANRQARQNATTQRISSLKAEVDAAADQAKQAADAAQSERDKVAAEQAKAQAAADNLEQKKSGLEAQQQQAAADQAAAQAIIDRLDEENRQKAAQSGQTLPSNGSVANLGSGSIGRPITGAIVVTSPFGNRFHPILHYWRLHDGVDLAASTGTPQYAAISGRATTSYDSSCGYAVFLNGIVDGNSVVIKYCHLSRQSVSNGQQVTKGQQIGLTGSTGGVTGPHVHFSVKINGRFIDPMTLPGF